MTASKSREALTFALKTTLDVHIARGGGSKAVARALCAAAPVANQPFILLIQCEIFGCSIDCTHT